MKRDNKQAVKAFRDADQTRKASDMAKELGLTRERVRQILVDLGLPTSFRAAVRVCENETCKNEISRQSTSKTCSRECFTAHRMGEFICDFCGETKTMRKALIAIQKSRYKNMYCNRSCRGKGYWARHRKLIVI